MPTGLPDWQKVGTCLQVDPAQQDRRHQMAVYYAIRHPIVG